MRTLAFLAAATMLAAPAIADEKADFYKGKTISLVLNYTVGGPTDTEARLALLLFTNIDRTLSRNHIFALAWGRTTLQMTRTIDTHISRLRLKLGLHEDNGVRLRAVYNVGYRLERIAHQGIDQLTDPMRPLALQA